MTSDRPRNPAIDGILHSIESEAPRTMAELQALLAARMAAYNRAPQAELGGLSPVQMQTLLDADWSIPNGAFWLDDSLSIQELDGSDLLYNARVFMEALASDGPAKATTAGNLTRAFVATMMDRMRWAEGYQDRVRAANKVINEHDVPQLEVLRIVLEGAGIVRRHRGFRLTRKGEGLLDNARVGQLQALLFRTFFRKFNLAYLDGAPAHSGVQHTIAWAFLIVRREAGDWVTPGQLMPQLWLEHVADPPTGSWHDEPTSKEWVVRSRILEPLISFGVLQRRELPPKRLWDRPYEVRTAPLFDRFLRFEPALVESTGRHRG